MRAGVFAALLVAGAVTIGGVAYAMKDDDEDKPNPLDEPLATGECLSAEDAWKITQDFLADEASTSADLRGLADGFDVLSEYCDDNARNMGKSCSALLRARAEVLDNTPPGQSPNQTTNSVNLPPSPIELPGGHYYQGYGWCLPGAVLDMKTGLCSVNMPDVIKTSGACCDSCAHGRECEGCS